MKKVSKGNLSSSQTKELSDRRQVIVERLERWLPVRAIYIPGLFHYLAELKSSTPSLEDSFDDIHSYPLWLPSSIAETRRRAICVEGLPGMEEKLRLAQMLDTLHSLKHTLRVKSRMIQFKKRNIRGQREGVRSRTVIDRVHLRAYKSAIEYRMARAALMELRGPGDWEKQLRELADGDIRSYVDPARVMQGPGRRGTTEEDARVLLAQETGSIDDDDKSNGSDVDRDDADMDTVRPRAAGTGETRKEISWIWRTTSLDIDDDTDNNDDVLRSEWCKSRARAKRAQEQVKKTKEEMRRTLVFLRWKGDQWRKRVDCRGKETERGLREGLNAYALKQASLQEELRSSFEALWKTPLADWDTVLKRDKYGGYDNFGDIEGDAWEDVQGHEGEDSDHEVLV